jgi:hypothetical protein
MKSILSTKELRVFIPKSDMTFFRMLSKKMGWLYTDVEKDNKGFDATDCEAYREAMDDIKEGRIYSASDADDLMTQILG